jgi:hypothetical protein
MSFTPWRVAAEHVLAYAGIRKKFERAWYTPPPTPPRYWPVADNAHYSHPDRDARLAGEQQLQLPAKYRGAHTIPWPDMPRGDVATNLAVVNSALLSDLPWTD